METEQIQEILKTVEPLLVEYGMSLLAAILILIIGWIVAGWVYKLVFKGLGRIKYFDATLKPFVASLARYIILILVITAVLAKFGVQTASIIALLGAAGLAVGLALQGTLSNIASGVMILLLRPFGIGDFVDVGGVMGTVEEVGLFMTRLKTADGLFRAVPNSKVWGTDITNFSRNPTRRIDVGVSVAYAEDIAQARAVLMEMINAEERVLKEPEPAIIVDALADSSVNLILRFWCARTDFLKLKSDMTMEAKTVLDAAGIEIPFPQIVVHKPQK